MGLARLIFVTGKGGTGKSTVAAALAHALSRRYPTVLADLDRRLSAAALLGAVPEGERRARIGVTLETVALSTRTELEYFIRRIVPIAAISRRMLKSRTFGYVTAALPGLEAFLLLERLRIMAGDAALTDSYVVVDAPASGTALELLAVARTLKGIAPAGTLNRLAESVESFLGDPERFGVILTAAPEELALRETLETAAALRERLGIATIAAVVNCCAPALFQRGEIATLAAHGAHARLASRRLREHALARAAHARLRRAGLRSLELPMMFTETIGTAEVARLGRQLESGLLAR
jgi:anion-transporting  ArsA/GET3 family ATPase